MEHSKEDLEDEEEMTRLRKQYQNLEKEARQLGSTKKKLENRLVQLQKQLCLEEQLVKQLKEKRTSDLKTLRKDYVEKFETAMNLLKVRVQVEMSQSLRRHKEQLKLSFRSDLLKLTRKNCQLTNLLRYIQQLQQLEKDTALKREKNKQHTCCKNIQEEEAGPSRKDHLHLYHQDLCCRSSSKSDSERFQALRSEFQKQIAKLLDELKERADGIETLNRNVEKSISEQERICKSASGISGGPKQFKVCNKQAPSDNAATAAIKKPLLISVQTSSLPSPSSSSSAVQGNCVPLLCLSNRYCGGGDECSVVGPVRQKNHRGTRESRTSPYDTSQAAVSTRRSSKRCNDVSVSVSSSEKVEGTRRSESSASSSSSFLQNCEGDRKIGTMRELDIQQLSSAGAAVDSGQSSYYSGHQHYQQHYQQHNLYQNHNVGHHHQYHQQCGSGILETLPEAESEEEEEEEEDCISSGTTGGKSSTEDVYQMTTRSPLVSSASPSSSTSCGTGDSPGSPQVEEFPSEEFVSLLGREDQSSASQSSASHHHLQQHHHHLNFFPRHSSLQLQGSGGGRLGVAKSLEDFGILQQQENQKISALESIIRQLRDELKECKDQNELLEFRLLEMQELCGGGGGGGGGGAGSSPSPVRPSRQQQVVVVGEEDGGAEMIDDEVEPKILAEGDSEGEENCETNNKIDDGPCLPNSESTEFIDEETGGNGHANVTESRSSCSDCSESLSLQESGIFDSQSTEDSPLSTVCRLTISRELVSLTFQIEELLRRFNEGVDESGGSGSPGASVEGGLQCVVSTRRGKTSYDLASDLQACRQRIQEFERRLAAMSDGNYIQGLEEKVNFLLNENRRLEDERAEIEEAENDNRLMCQRLEEKLGHLQKKKLLLQNRLSLEKKCIEQLRLKVVQMQDREEDLCSQISRVEGLLQNYEQRNFELEENCIEMKCSVQFVVQSIPMFVLCYYYGQLLKTTHQKCSQGVNFLLRSLPATDNINQGDKDNVAVIGQHSNYHNEFAETLAMASASSSSLSSAAMPPVIPDVSVSRKHKLGGMDKSTLELEPQLKKLRRILDMNGITCFCNCAKCGAGGGKIDNDGFEEKGLMTGAAETQTGEDLWRNLVEQMFGEQKVEWQKAEKVLLRKIEILECDIDKCQEMFDQERGKLIKMYEEKLKEKEEMLRETQQSIEEKKELQEKWNCLIEELEQFALYFVRNLTSGEEDSGGMGGLAGEDGSGAERGMVTIASKLGEVLPSFGGSFGVDGVEAGKNKEVVEVMEKARLIGHLQNTLREHLNTWEKREKHLLEEIDRLTTEINDNIQNNSEENESERQHQDRMIAYLNKENERLTILFQDHEKVWGELRQLQEEHEKLQGEMGTIVTLRRKVEEQQKNDQEMRDRLDELERSEQQLKNEIAEVRKKEQKGQEKIQQLRDEIQFLRQKCCQLQDDLDGRVQKDKKYKSEIQALTVKLRESSLELEEKESQLESNETALQSQIQKLKNQLGELHQAYADNECSNGMLREEVSYLERTVEEAIAKAVLCESTVSTLSHELKQKDETIEELQRRLEKLATAEPIAIGSAASLEPMNPNDLAIFNRHDGGLHGVARDVEEVVTLLQRCTHCEKLGTKLMDIVERLIVLIQILKTSQIPEGHLLHGDIDSLSRCESEEMLGPACDPKQAIEGTTGGASTSDGDGELIRSVKPAKREEEEDLMIANLQETMSHLSLQIHNLEDAFYIRQKEMRDSYLSETSWWKTRCDEKNKLIELLGRRISQLCVSDIQGFYIAGILREIEKVRESASACHHHHQFPSQSPPSPISYSSSSTSSSSTVTTTTTFTTSQSIHHHQYPVEPPPRKRSPKKQRAVMAAANKGATQVTSISSTTELLPTDFTCETLSSYLLAERKRVMAILEDTLDENKSIEETAFTTGPDEDNKGNSSESFQDSSSSPLGLEFRVLRKIGHDSLLVSWSTLDNHLSPATQVNGYEIEVNGQNFLRINQPNRQKVILFGLDLDEPLRLTLRCSGASGEICEESTITYIN